MYNGSHQMSPEAKSPCQETAYFSFFLSFSFFNSRVTTTHMEATRCDELASSDVVAARCDPLLRAHGLWPRFISPPANPSSDDSILMAHEMASISAREGAMKALLGKGAGSNAVKEVRRWFGLKWNVPRRQAQTYCNILYIYTVSVREEGA